MRWRNAGVLLHRYVGLAIAAFVTVAGLTGSVLAYIGPLHEALVPPRYVATARGEPLTLQALASHVAAAEPRARVVEWPLSLQPGHAAVLRVEALPPAQGTVEPLAFDTAYVDPVSGEVLGWSRGSEGGPFAERALDFIYRLHHSLALPGGWSRWGSWIMGVAALLWFVDCFVGAWLTLPRGRPSAARWKPAWLVRRQRLNFDLHRAGGLWFWGMLAILALSSVQQNLNAEVFMPAARLVATLTPYPEDVLPLREPPLPPPGQLSADAAYALARAEAVARGWRDVPERIQIDDARGVWRIVFKTPRDEWFTATRRELYFDDLHGMLLYAAQPGRGTRGDTLVDWLAALHFGTVLGWPYKLLLCVTGVAIAMLSVTGLVVWWRKRRGRLRARVLRHA